MEPIKSRPIPVSFGRYRLLPEDRTHQQGPSTPLSAHLLRRCYATISPIKPCSPSLAANRPGPMLLARRLGRPSRSWLRNLSTTPRKDHLVHATWTACTTQANYLASLALWTDAARDRFFTADPESNPFFLGTPLWVIRAHRFHLHEQPHYHGKFKYQTPIAITTRPTRIGRVSVDVEHDMLHVISDAHTHKLATISSTIVVVNTKEEAVPWTDAQRERMLSHCQAPTVPSSRDFPDEPAPFEINKYEFRTRPSDLDGIGHVNNARYFEFFQDARAFAELKAREGACHHSLGQAQAVGAVSVSLPPIRSVYLEYIGPAYGDELLRIESWSQPPDASLQGLCLQLARGEDILARCIVQET